MSVIKTNYAKTINEDIPTFVDDAVESISSHLRFTGWKGWVDSNGDLEPEKGFVCQWIWFNPVNRDRNVYVNLPGMQAGVFTFDDKFDIGTERVFIDTPKEVRDAFIQKGFDILKELITKET